MKIGIFDSGLGGLVILRELKRKLPGYDFVFLGDTKNLPYGDKPQRQIFNMTVRAIEFLFKLDCALVIVACNTASSQALRRIQREWLPKSKFSDRRVLGVIRPTVEMVENLQRVGLIGTVGTVDSSAYSQELAHINPKIQLVERPTPELVPMIESGSFNEKVVKSYLRLFENEKIDSLILACTHYGLIKDKVRKILGKKIKVIAQEELLPGKLKSYLIKHTEIERNLSKNGKLILQVTKINPHYLNLTRGWFGKNIKLKVIKYRH